jgi:hypothetical protein
MIVNENEDHTKSILDHIFHGGLSNRTVMSQPENNAILRLNSVHEVLTYSAILRHWQEPSALRIRPLGISNADFMSHALVRCRLFPRKWEWETEKGKIKPKIKRRREISLVGCRLRHDISRWYHPQEKPKNSAMNPRKREEIHGEHGL